MPTLTTTTTTSSSSSPRLAPRHAHARDAGGSGQGCGRPVGRAAGIVGGGIAAAFFASLERCACVEVRTKDDDPLVDAEAAAPLMLGAGDSSAAANRSGARGRRWTATAGKGKRSGLGCCENSAIN